MIHISKNDVMRPKMQSLFCVGKNVVKGRHPIVPFKALEEAMPLPILPLALRLQWTLGFSHSYSPTMLYTVSRLRKLWSCLCGDLAIALEVLRRIVVERAPPRLCLAKPYLLMVGCFGPHSPKPESPECVCLFCLCYAWRGNSLHYRKPLGIPSPS